MVTRRQFLGDASGAVAGLAIGSTAKSYSRIFGANERVQFAMVGTGSRAYGLLSGLQANAESSTIAYVCDADSAILGKYESKARELGHSPRASQDFRRVLESKEVDALAIATPDHWHAPMAVLGLQAGKHIYVEKPSSHSPYEGEILILAQRKYGKLVQVGNQRRSSENTIRIIKDIHDGRIGRAYHGKAWYADARPSMGVGKVVPAPPNLNWDLWQGPAPRGPYKDNLHPYNWHWLRRYGTGEALNNGTHEVDLCRWALEVEYPERVSALGGRYQFQDDWEFYDTLSATFAYPDKTISWEGTSDQGMKQYGRYRGVLIQGADGSVIIDHEGYEVFDWKGNKIASDGELEGVHPTIDHAGQDNLTNAHFRNFINAIRLGQPLHSPISEINTTITSLQLANISWITNRDLKIDTKSGRIENDLEAMKLWHRQYEKGWEIQL